MTPACPHCSTGTEPASWNDVRGFACRLCRGHWIRGKQIELFLDSQGSGKFDRLVALVRAAPASSRVLICPACEARSFRELRHAGAEIDACVSCSGVYFDAGEVRRYMRDALVRRFGTDSVNHVSDDASSGIDGVFDIITTLLD